MKFLKNRKKCLTVLFLVVVVLLVSIVILFFSLSLKDTSHAPLSPNSKSGEVLTLLASSDSLKNYDIKRSISIALEAEEIAKVKGMDSLLPKIYMAQGKLFISNSEYPQALEKLLAAETYYEGVADPIKKEPTFKRDYAICLQKISEVHFQLNRLNQALEYIEASIAIYKELEDPYQLAKACLLNGA